MFARISTILDCAEDEFWQKLIDPRSLQFIASPLLSYQTLDGIWLDSQWVAGKTYQLKLYLGGIAPLGRHNVKIVAVNRESNQIASHESGALISVWNHTMRFQQLGEGKLRYTDEIEMKAGWLTPGFWLFAHLFYRYRQQRWKVLLKKKRHS